MTSTEDFYEDDEPVEKVREAFAKGEKGVTRKREDFSERTHAVMQETAERSERGDGGNVFVDNRLDEPPSRVGSFSQS